MASHLNLKKVVESSDKKNAKLHWMPCIIKNDGEANVSMYFEPIITRRKDNVLQSSFRGYPLLGEELSVPEKYHGVVVQETLDKLNENAGRNLYGVKTFDKFTYWNWDTQPSENDKIQMAFDWFHVSEAIHSPNNS